MEDLEDEVKKDEDPKRQLLSQLANFGVGFFAGLTCNIILPIPDPTVANVLFTSASITIGTQVLQKCHSTTERIDKVLPAYAGAMLGQAAYHFVKMYL